jgi:diadenylate cyclase
MVGRVEQGETMSEEETGEEPRARESHILKRIEFGEAVADRQVLESVVLLAVEIAREGREGRKIGTMFVVFDTEATLERSKALILDPLWYHDSRRKHIDDPDLRETVKELAQLDGAFIVREDGVVLSACRYINATSEGIQLPMGLGSRHMAGASISKVTGAVSVVVSESSMVRVFQNGKIVAEIMPEAYLMHWRERQPGTQDGVQSGSQYLDKGRDS